MIKNHVIVWLFPLLPGMDRFNISHFWKAQGPNKWDLFDLFCFVSHTLKIKKDRLVFFACAEALYTFFPEKLKAIKRKWSGMKDHIFLEIKKY